MFEVQEVQELCTEATISTIKIKNPNKKQTKNPSYILFLKSEDKTI